MTHIDASQLDYRQLNAAIRDCAGDVAVTGCLGQRFIGAGRGHDRLTITGTPAMRWAPIWTARASRYAADAQDAVGDTMNAGRIIVHGSIGDAAGYAMRGGELYVAGNAGYRAGIHMKAYGDKLPVMVIGGRAGSFLGEYQAGGIIIVLGLTDGSRPIVSNFPCTGMHGGKLFLRLRLPGHPVSRSGRGTSRRSGRAAGDRAVSAYVLPPVRRALRCAPAPSVHRRHA